MLDQQREAFREEALELLTDLEESLLALEEDPGDADLVARVFRAMHTIKGSGAMFGFEAIATFTHEVETVFDLVRNGEIPVTRELVDLSLSARDHILSLLRASEQCAEADSAQGAALGEAFRHLLPNSGIGEGEKSESDPVAAEAPPGGDAGDTFRIRLKLPPDIVMRGTRPDGLLRELVELGPCRIIAQTDAIPLLEDLDPTSCAVEWDVILTTCRGIDAIKDVFIFVEDEIDLKIDIIDVGNDLDVTQDYKRIGELLVERGDIRQEDLDEVVNSIKPLGQLLIDSKKVLPGKVAAALQEQEVVRTVRSQRQSEGQGQSQESTASVRVPAERLDLLVDLVGELVTVQSRLSQSAGARHDAELLSIAEEVERLTNELRDSTLNLRMLPIGTIFGKFKRLVRDLCRDLGKEIELVTEGGDTELDKTVIECLGDPLVHILRNSMDHGIESPEERKKSGKSAQGTVKLCAEHSGDSVVITIADDGKGLDLDRIRAKAIEKGIIQESDELAVAEIQQLIFAPGFSTAASVSSVSGRGVGMDVVKKAIESLRGRIELESEPGRGTTLRIRLPLTLAIIDSLLTRVGEETYLLPLSLVEECVELTAAERKARHGRNVVAVRGQLVPYIDLRESFAIAGERPAIAQVVITGLNEQRIGFVVDRVVGEHQTVIKSLGRMYRDAEGLSGATILGDGSVALILDVPQLVRMSEAEEREAVA